MKISKFFTCGLLNDPVNSSDYVAVKTGWMVHNKLEGMYNKLIIV